MDRRGCQVYSLLSARTLYAVARTNFSGGFSFPGERHNFWEFSYIVEGSIGCTSGDHVYICHAGDGILHAPNQFHTMWVNESDACEIFTIAFDGTGMESRLHSGKYKLTEVEKHGACCILEELEALLKASGCESFEDLKDLPSANRVEFQMIKSYLEIICLSLVRRGRHINGKPLADADSLCYAKITAFLRDNIEQKLTLEDICRGVYESPAKVKEVFHRFTNGGVMHYFNQMRCDYAMQLIAAGNSVKSIADTMHFSSPYYLSYFFKRETGMTPQQYKKQLKG